jgi:hypothetical protein
MNSPKSRDFEEYLKFPFGVLDFCLKMLLGVLGVLGELRRCSLGLMILERKV